MFRPRRGGALLSIGLVVFGVTLIYLYGARPSPRWPKTPNISQMEEYLGIVGHNRTSGEASSFPSAHITDTLYLRHLVVAKMKDEEADWLYEEIENRAMAKVYIPDDPLAPLTVPKNKGREAMVYLTYIIDNYDDLPDVAIFMHAHKNSWHQAGLMQHDGAETIRRLSSSRVLREGYMNLRCEWNPGCTKYMHPGSPDLNSKNPEEPEMAKAWAELFPTVRMPESLAQPCCAQFAVSRDYILAVPKQDFIFYRDWLLQTSLSDEVSGRVFEHIWQFIFTQSAVLCPDMYACYCDGFGVCFKDAKDFDYWFEIRWEKHLKEEKLQDWRLRATELDRYRQAGELTGIESLELKIPSAGIDVDLLAEIKHLETVMEEGRQKAIGRGRDPAFRARVSGRNWTEGDGF